MIANGFRNLDPSIRKMFDGVMHDHINHAPRGFVEITEKEFAQSAFFTYPFECVEYRQLLRTYEGEPLNMTERGEMLPVKLFLMHDGTGYGMHSDFWSKKVRYFRFGCRHQYHSYGPEEAKSNGWPYDGGRCMHNEVCIYCGHLRQYDSSD